MKRNTMMILVAGLTMMATACVMDAEAPMGVAANEGTTGLAPVTFDALQPRDLTPTLADPTATPSFDRNLNLPEGLVGASTPSVSPLAPPTVAAPELDVLFVVSNHKTMCEEQSLMGEHFDAMTRTLQRTGADFNLAVIDTTPTGELRQAGDESDACGQVQGECGGEAVMRAGAYGQGRGLAADALGRDFACRASVGNDAEGQDRGMEAMVAALKGRPDFLRPKAHLAIVIVSDNDDCSHEGALDGEGIEGCAKAEALVPVERYAQALLELKDGDASLITVTAITGHEHKACESDFSGEATESPRYTALASHFGGQQAQSVCDLLDGGPVGATARMIEAALAR